MPRRYPPALVVLHWLSAFLILGALIGGTFNMADVPNSDPAKLATLRMHMIVGLSVLVLLAARLVVRLRRPLPAPMETGALGRVARLTHFALYALAFAMALSGLALGAMSGLGAAVFGSGALPESFHAFPPRAAHGVIAKLLMAVVALHVAAALWHALVTRDGIFARMWFGK